MRHLDEKHGIKIEIPKRQTGRPKDSDRDPLSISSRSSRQCMKRFYDKDHKIKNARKKQIKVKERKALLKWESKPEAEKEALSFEEWRDEYVADEMDWEKKMPDREARIDRDTKRGYEKMVSLLLPRVSNIISMLSYILF